MVSSLDFIMIVIETYSAVLRKRVTDIFYDFKKTTLAAKQKIDVWADTMRESRETSRRQLKRSTCKMVVT